MKGESSIAYGVMLFSSTRGGVAFDGIVITDSADAAIQMAARMARWRAGSIAFYRTCSANGEVEDDAVELARYGQMPARLRHLLCA